MSTVIQDVRYALRTCIRNPVFTAAAVLTLALGIGANTAIFSLIQSVLLQPLPVEDPDRLVSPAGAILSYPAYLDFRDQTGVFDDLAAYDTLGRRLRMSSDSATELVSGESVSANYFRTMRMDMALGRGFNPEMDNGAVAVISHALWQRSFLGDPAIIGKTVEINDQPLEIIGVAAPRFRGIRLNGTVDLWFPIDLHPAVTTGGAASITLDARGMQWLRMIGRLKFDVSEQQALIDLNRTGEQFNLAFPTTDQWQFDTLETMSALVIGNRRNQTADFIWMLYGAVCVALLIACANAANLLLLRSETRRREISIRLAVGAGRGRLMRQFITESLLLSLMGGGVGILCALWILDGLQGFELPGRISVERLALGFDLPMLGFTVFTSIITGLLFGLAPAFQASAVNTIGALKEGLTGGTRERSWLRKGFVVVQVALCLVLLIGSGLLVRSMDNILNTDLGFKTDRVLLASVDLGVQGYEVPQAKTYYAAAAERVRNLPGVVAASWAFQVPVERRMYMEDIAISGYQPEPNESMGFMINFIGTDYFRTMQIPLLQGSPFAEQAGDAVVINKTMADRYWPGQNPVGRQIQLAGNAASYEVVAVVSDSKYRGFDEAPMPFLYLPFEKSLDMMGLGERRLLVRTIAAPSTMISSVRRAMQQPDAALMISNIMTWEQHFGDLLRPQRMGMTLLVGFGLLALILAAIGIYGVVAYSVSQRTREIGVRMVLGAQMRDVVRFVMVEGLRLTAFGIVVGLLAALAASQVFVNQLYGITATDPTTYLLIACFLLVVAALAIAVPAYRALRVDPIDAIRYE